MYAKIIIWGVDEMNFKDRGNKKWNSLMLVDHQKRLKKLKMKEKEIKKPELSPEELKKMDFKIQKAVAKNLTVEITYYKNKRIKKIKGKILKIKKYKNQVEINTINNQKKTLNFKQFLNITL